MVGVEAGRMAASNVLMLKKAGDKRQEQALQEAFKVSMAKLCAYNYRNRETFVNKLDIVLHTLTVLISKRSIGKGGEKSGRLTDFQESLIKEQHTLSEETVQCSC